MNHSPLTKSFVLVALFFTLGICITSCSQDKEAPVKAYHQFWKAIKNKNIQGVRDNLAGMEKIPDDSGEWANYFYQMHQVLPVKIVVEKVSMEGALAYLYLLETGMYNGEQVRQSKKVTMKNISGNWKVFRLN